MKKLLLLFAVAAFAGCETFVGSEQDLSSISEIKLDDSSFLIDQQIVDLNIEDVKNVSKNFFYKNKPSTRISSTSVDDSIHSIQDSNGIPLMYIINYGVNNGFSIVSATKKYAPIIAYSENGHWNETDTILNTFIEEYKCLMEGLGHLNPDSLRLAHAIEWLSYEKKNQSAQTRVLTPSDQVIEHRKAQASADLQSQGYTVYAFNQALQLIPPTSDTPDRAERFVQELCSNTHPSFDCMDVNLFATKSSHEELGPLLQTAWNQSSPYCGNAVNGVAGCFTIAMAQVMKYHEWPLDYSWSDILDDYSYVTDANSPYVIALHELINSILRTSYPVYYGNPFSTDNRSTEISLSNGVHTLRENGYIVTEDSYYGYSERWNTIHSLQGGKPVIMIGTNPNTGKGHAWVCDGFRYDITQYAAMYLETFGDYFFHNGISDFSNCYLHMNLGWGLGYNVWLYNDSMSNTDFNYSSNRKYILLTPNR